LSQLASGIPAARPKFRGTYIGICVVMIAIITVGFWPSYFGLIGGAGLEEPLFVHLHAFVYISWMALFTTQVVLVATRRVAAHRQLGQFAIYWGFAVLGMGIATALLSFAAMVADGDLARAQLEAIWPLLDMVVFALFFIPAVSYRHKPEMHKRFMIVATTNLIVAAVARVVGLETPSLHLAFILVWLSPIIIAMIHDYLSRRIVHPVYLAGAAVLAATTFRDSFATTDVWLGFTEWLAIVTA